MATPIAASGPTLSSAVYARRLQESASGTTLSSEAIKSFRGAHGGSPQTGKEITLASRTAAETQGLTGREQIATAAILAHQAQAREKPTAPKKTAAQIISESRDIAQIAPRAFYPAISGISQAEQYKEKVQSLESEESAIYAGRAPKASREIIRESRSLTADSPKSFYNTLQKVSEREKATEPIYGGFILGKTPVFNEKSEFIGMAYAKKDTKPADVQWRGFVGNEEITEAPGAWQQGYSKVNTYLRKNVTYPAAMKLKKIGLTSEKADKFITTGINPGLNLIPQKYRTRFLGRAGEYITEQPAEVAMYAGASSIAGAGLTWLSGSKLALSSRAAYKSINFGINTLAVGSGIAAVGIIGLKIKTNPGKIPEILAETTVQLSASIGGAWLGSKIAQPATYLNRNILSTPAQTETTGTVKYNTKTIRQEFNNPFKRITENNLPATRESAVFRESEIPFKSTATYKIVTTPKKMTYIKTGDGFYEEGMQIGNGNINVETVRPIGKNIYVLKSIITPENKITTSLFKNKNFIAKFTGETSPEFSMLEPKQINVKGLGFEKSTYPYTKVETETNFYLQQGIPNKSDYFKSFESLTQQNIMRRAELSSPPIRASYKLGATESGQLTATPESMNILKSKIKFASSFKLPTTTQTFKGTELKENVQSTFTTLQESKQFTTFKSFTNKDIFVNPRFYSGVPVSETVLQQPVPKVSIARGGNLLTGFGSTTTYAPKFSPIVLVSPKLGLSTKQETILRPETKQLKIPKIGLVPAMGKITMPGLKPATEQLKVPVVVPITRTTITKMPTPEPPYTPVTIPRMPFNPPTFTPPATPFIIPDMGASSFAAPSKELRIKQLKKYTPTLTASAFKISGSPFKLGVSTGLGQRPIATFKMPKIGKLFKRRKRR